MIPLIQKEITANSWLTQSELIDIIAISEMTPGAIAVNSATYVGYKVMGFLGGLIATAAIPIPSLVFALLISRYLLKQQKSPLHRMIFYGIRPVIVGLIISAALLVSKTALFRMPSGDGIFGQLLKQPFHVINIGSILIFILVLAALIKYKLHPILVIVSSGILGIFIFSFI